MINIGVEYQPFTRPVYESLVLNYMCVRFQQETSDIPVCEVSVFRGKKKQEEQTYGMETLCLASADGEDLI